LTLILIYLIDISNDLRLMSHFIDMIYIIISINPTVDFIIRLYGKKNGSRSSLFTTFFICYNLERDRHI